MDTTEFFGREKISRILLKLAPPVMLAQLIQALYNIVDSLFIGRFSETGLTALSIVYPIQLLMIALAVGTGVGINTVMAAKYGENRPDEADGYAGVGTPLALALWALFAAAGWLILPFYAKISTSSADVIRDVVMYGRIVCVFSFGLFLESIWTKVLQAGGDMKTPTIAQITGAVVNIVLDPLLIFGLFGLPQMGIAGAAVATVVGQMAAAAIVGRKGFRKSPAKAVYPGHIAQIFRLGVPNILMQSAYTFYILGLNLILAGFSDQAVTALGLYYKWQTFFFIPLGAMQTCIVPVISYNYAARSIDRCRKTLSVSVYFGWALMALGALCFNLIPVVLFVPLGFVFSRFGLHRFWLTFPVTETVTSLVGVLYYRQFLSKSYVQEQKPVEIAQPALRPSHPGVIITIAREHGSSGKQIGRRVAETLGIPFYYKEMIALAAHESGLDSEFISSIHKNAPDVLRELYLSSSAVQYAVEAQAKIIRRIAENGSCVIVGRAADYVLRGAENVVRVFIHAPEAYRMDRVREIYGDTAEEAARSIRRSDAARASYYKHIAGERWGDARHYELTVDSSVGIEKSADTIVRYVRSRE